MKKYLLSLVSFMLVCFAASAETYYRIDASKVISADATALDGITAVVTDVAGEKTWVSFSGGDDQDINANCTTVHDWSSNSEYSSIKFFAVEGQADDVYYIKFVNAEGAFYVPKGGWHDQSGCMNVTGNGGGLFVGGLNGQNGQDAANGALWKVTKTAEGYTLYNIGKERYAVPGIGVTATETSVVLYSEFESVTYNPEAEGDYTGRIVNNKVTGADGWTCERPVGGNGPLLNGTAFEYWGGNASSRQDAAFNYYQKIAGLPAGKYVLGVEMKNSSNGEGAGHEPNGNAGLYIANGETESFVGVTEDGEELLPYTTQEVAVNEGDEITVGVKSIGYMSARWFVADNFTLVRTGDLPKRQLDNADFAEGVIGDVNIATYAKDGEVNQMQAVPGWAFGVENGDARAAGVVAYGSGTTLGGAAYTVPAAGPEGTNGNALGLVGVWTGTVKYVQDVTLSAGKYTMTVPVYNTAGTNAFVKNLIGVKYGETEVLASTKSYPVGQWVDQTVVFELAEETTVTVSLGYEGANVGSGASQHLFYDCVKIEAYDEVAVAKAAALAALPVADASIFTPNVEDVEAVKAAIEAATTVAEVEEAAATELAIPALSGEWTVKNANADFYLGEAKLSADVTITTFEQAEGGFRIKVGDKYINMAGGNTWSMNATETASTVWNFTLKDGKYTIKGPNGLIGSDNLAADAAVYGNKAEANNGLWVIEEYVNPDAKEVVLLYTLDTTLEENKGDDNGYATACDVTVGDITWNVTGNATMAPWRLGGKNLENVDRVVKTTTAYAGDVQKVVLTLGDVVNGITVNSVTLAYADNAEFTDAKTIVKDHATSLEFAPEGGFGANMFYQFAVNVTVPGTSNKYVTFNKVELYGYAPEGPAEWDGETVLTSMDNGVVTKLEDLNGLVITLPGAKSIEALSVEEAAYLTLQNQDGSELYGIWAPMYDGTCTIDGDKITLSGFITVAGATGAIPVGTTKLYIEDYGTFKVDGEEVYIPTIELQANIEAGAQPFDLTSVVNNEVEGTVMGAEASEQGVSYQFNVTATGKVLSKGEGVPTLSIMENAEENFGAATVLATESETAYIRFMAKQQYFFTTPGTYILTIPEGTFVDAEGTPNAAATVKWVIVQGGETGNFAITGATNAQNEPGTEVEALSYAFEINAANNIVGLHEGNITLTDAENQPVGGNAYVYGYEGEGGAATVYARFTFDTEDHQLHTPGVYTLNVPAGMFKDAEGNLSEAYTASWTIKAAEGQTINIETVEIGTDVDDSFAPIVDVRYTATVKFQKPAGAKYAYSEGLFLSKDGEPSAVPFMIANGNMIGFAELPEGDEVTLKFTDNMFASSTDPEVEPDMIRAAGSYVATTTITFMDENQWEIADVVAQYTGSIVLPEVEEKSELAEGDYVLMNMATGTYLNGSNSWGTQASVTKHGQFMTLAKLEDGKYTIDSHIANNATSHFLGTNGYVDAAAAGFTFTEIAEGIYTIANGDNLLATNAENTVVAFNATEATDAAMWKLMSKEDILAAMADATADAPVDATALVPDADFSRNNQDFNKWEGESKMGKGGPNTASDATARGMNAEKWGGNSTSIDFHYTLTDLPNGKYTVKFQGLYRYNNTTDNTNDIAAATHADGTEKILANFYANEVKTPFMSIADEASVETYGKMPFSQTEASEAFTKGAYQNEVEVEVFDGTLTLKVEKLEADHEGCDWTILDNIELYYLGTEVGPQVVATATAVVGESEPNEYGDQFYTVTVTVAADDIAELGATKAYMPEGIKFTYAEDVFTFMPTALDGLDVVAGEDVVFLCKDAMPCYTSDTTYEGDLRQAGQYHATCTIIFTDADDNELGTATYEGDLILPTATGINEVTFKANSVIYTIGGVRVQKPVKGVNIINGKKVVIK